MHSLLTAAAAAATAATTTSTRTGATATRRACHSVPMPCPFDDARWAQLRAAAATAGGEEAETGRALQEATTKAEAEHDGFAQRRTRGRSAAAAASWSRSASCNHARLPRVPTLPSPSRWRAPKAATAPT